MKIERYTGVIKGKFENWELFLNDLKRFEGKRLRYVLTNDKKRSNEQNRYWWSGVVKRIADWLRDAGNDVLDNDVHEFLKMKYLGKREVKIDGKIFERYRSTTELTTTEFSDLIEKIQRDFAKRGLIISDPQQQEFLEEE